MCTLKYKLVHEHVSELYKAKTFKFYSVFKFGTLSFLHTFNVFWSYSYVEIKKFCLHHDFWCNQVHVWQEQNGVPSTHVKKQSDTIKEWGWENILTLITQPIKFDGVCLVLFFFPWGSPPQIKKQISSNDKSKLLSLSPVRYFKQRLLFLSLLF